MPSNKTAKNGDSSPLDNCEERIKQLHGHLTLEKLKETIDKELGMKVSVHKYRLKFKQLRLGKHLLKQHETDTLCIMLARMPQGSKLFLWGKPLPQASLDRIRSRGRPSIFTQVGSYQLPRGYAIRPPKPERVNHFAGNLPFSDFIHALRTVFEDPTWQRLLEGTVISPRLIQNGESALAAGAECLVQEAWNLTSLSLDGTQALGNTFFAINPRAFAVLGIVPPLSVVPDCVPISSPNNDSRIVNHLLSRQLLFSVANGFAGIDKFPIWQPFKVLRETNVQTLIQLFRVAQGPTMRAIAQGLFKASIESGNHTILNVVLSCEAVYMDVNKEKVFVDGKAYTPLERASMLRHHETIKALLRHGADLNKTYGDSSRSPCGALEWAVHRYSGPNDDTFELLTKVVDNLTSNERCLIHLIRHHSQKCDPFSEVVDCVFGHFSEQGSLDVLEELGNLIINPRLLNEVAKRGHAKLYEKLASEYGLRPNDDTLFASIEGGNTHLVQSLLSCGSSIHRLWASVGLPTTPLSIAIEIGKEEIINLFRRHGGFSCFPCWDVFLAAWDAAEIAQNKEILDEMMNIKPEVTDHYGSRDWALKIACRTGNYEVAKELLNKGTSCSSGALGEAIRNQQLPLIDLLLDYTDDIGYRELALAAEIGNHPIIRALLSEGAKPGRQALHAALRWKDKRLADLLLDAGADINGFEEEDVDRLWHPKNRRSEASALQVTAELGDQDLVQYVLKKGADPNDLKALNIAYGTNLKVFKTILAAYKGRYNRRVQGFGSAILVLAVKSADLTLVRMLLEHNVDTHGFVKQRQRRFGSKGKDPASAQRQLLEHNVDKDGFSEQGYQGVTPFGYAILIDNSNDLSMVSEFLRYSCHPSDMAVITNKRGPMTKSGTTAFIVAIERGDMELVRRLVKEDEEIINAPARGRAKRTALQRAAEIGSLEMVKLLHNLGAHVNEPPHSNSGATALQLAAIQGSGQIVDYLLDHGADVNARAAAINGMTALVGAASRGRIDIVAMLLNWGAGRDEDGREQFERALSEAEEHGHYPTYDYLMERWNGQQREGSLQDFSMEEFVDLDASVEE
ncbi:ankyrin [Xylaria scruposa]|nr:ankyrin [Xylaria scruposa]